MEPVCLPQQLCPNITDAYTGTVYKAWVSFAFSLTHCARQTTGYVWHYSIASENSLVENPLAQFLVE